jgi:hypothetical protein
MEDLRWEDGDPLAGPERWTHLVGYEGVYEISTFGQVRRIAPGRGVKGPLPRIMKTPPNADGYLTIRLSKDCEPKTHNVHVLVGYTFHGEPPAEIVGDAELNHINGRRDDCCATNLEWTSKYTNLEKRRQHDNELTDEDIAAMAGVGREERVA